MPFLQIIPYVADQFDEGVYVFDGGTFDTVDMMQRVDRTGFYQFESVAFATQDIFESVNINLGVYQWDTFQFDTRDMFDDRVLIFAEGIDWQPSVVTTAPSAQFLIPEQLEWQPSVENFSSDTTEFSRIVIGQVQNHIDQPQTRPIILDSRTSINRTEIEPYVIHKDNVVQQSQSAELTPSGVTIEPFQPYASSKVSTLAPTGSVELAVSVGDDRDMYIESSGGIVETTPLVTITSLMTQYVEPETPIHTPQFSM